MVPQAVNILPIDYIQNFAKFSTILTLKNKFFCCSIHIFTFGRSIFTSNTVICNANFKKNLTIRIAVLSYINNNSRY